MAVKPAKEIYDTVERNVNTLKSRLFSGEWRVCAGILGDKRAFASATVLNNSGFKSRAKQSIFLAAQLGKVDALKVLARYFSTSAYMSGSNKNLSRSLEYKALYENPPLDEYGMIPYLDEIIGSDFIMDFNRGGVIINPTGSMHRHLIELIEEGKLLDPRDIDANETTREEFINYVKKELPEYAEIFYEKAFMPTRVTSTPEEARPALMAWSRNSPDARVSRPTMARGRPVREWLVVGVSRVRTRAAA